MQPGVRSDGAILQPRKPQSQVQDWHPGYHISPARPSQETSEFGIYDNNEDIASTFVQGGLLQALLEMAERFPPIFGTSLHDIRQRRKDPFLPAQQMGGRQPSHLQQKLQRPHGPVRFQNSIRSPLDPFLQIPRLLVPHITLRIDCNPRRASPMDFELRAQDLQMATYGCPARDRSAAAAGAAAEDGSAA
jgi:hypothetical protein